MSVYAIKCVRPLLYAIAYTHCSSLVSTVPSAYIHALEYFVRAKQERAAEASMLETPQSSNSTPSLSAIYAYQLKYVISLSRQIPESSSSILATSSRTVNINAPSIARSRPMVQGPFLLQPSPLELQGEEGQATDIAYIDVTGSSSLHLDDNGNEERLGVIALSYSDGKVDVCLDAEKIEAIWEPVKVFNSPHLSYFTLTNPYTIRILPNLWF